MKLDLPVDYQTEDWNCGPTCIRLVVKSLLGVYPHFDETKYVNGMEAIDLAFVFRKFGIWFGRYDEVERDMIEQSIDKGYPIIVAVTCPYQKIPHYAVIFGYDEDGVNIANYYKDRDHITWSELEETQLDEMLVCWEI